MGTEIDPLETETVTRQDFDALLMDCIEHLGEEMKKAFANRDEVIRALMVRVANLEVQRVANENNQEDPEWY